MNTDTIFARIIRREVDADIVYEDAQCLAFRDINPQAPVHILVIPKRTISGLQTVNAEDEALLGHLLVTAQRVARQQGIAASGFRCIINAGEDGGQEVPHLHLHVLGGRSLGPLVN